MIYCRNEFIQFYKSIRLCGVTLIGHLKYMMCIRLIDDSPPSIRIKIGIGSGAFEPSGVLAVLPGSTIHLDCMYQRRRGNPEWTWTGWHRTYQTGNLNVV